MNSQRSNATPIEPGFTLVELAVVIIIVGVLAAFAVPRFRESVERSKASEAFSYMRSLGAAQERFHARESTYASEVSDLDVKLPESSHFAVGTLEPGSTGSFEHSWSLTLTRSGESQGYGRYTVVFTEAGYDATRSTIAARGAINPLEGSRP